MPIDTSKIRAVVFDYGNTLVEFGHEKVRLYDRAVAEILGKLFGPPDLELLSHIRDRDRMAPYSGNPPQYRENCLPDITRALIYEMYGRYPTPQELEHVLRVRYEAFLNLIKANGNTTTFLAQLEQRYKLGLVSNYPDGNAIRASLQQVKLAKYFQSVVVSGDIGFCKPHPLPFERVCGQLGVEPAETVFVGDNWLADIQGAKRAGMRAVHLVQWQPHETFEQDPRHHQPDAVAKDLEELQAMLMAGSEALQNE